MQRGIAGAEIVQRDADAERAELVQRRERRVVVRDQDGFGDLQLQPARVEPGLGERSGDLQRQRPDRNWIGETLTAMLTSAGQVAASAQAVRSTHCADLHDQAGFLGDRDEVGRRDHAAHRMPPAQQRLEAGDPIAVADRPCGW